MKIILVLFVIIITMLSFSNVIAAPFLVCDPFPVGADQPTHFVVTMDGGVPVVSTALKLADNTVILHHDLSGVSPGNHTVVVKSRIDDPLWGVLESPISSPLVFPRPVNPKGACKYKVKQTVKKGHKIIPKPVNARVQ